MGAVRMRVQTAAKNITIIHTTPVHQLTCCEVKSSMFVINKSIIKMFLTLLFASEKVVSSESGEKYVQIKHCLQVKSKTNMYRYVDFEDIRDGLKDYEV